MKDNINRLMKLVSIVEQIADSEHFSNEQLIAKQNLQKIVADGLQAIEECSTHLRRVEYERNLYYKLLSNVAPHELEQVYNQVSIISNTQLESNENSEY